MLMRILGALLLSAAALSQADSIPGTSTQLHIGDSSGGDRRLAAELARGYLQSRGGGDIQVTSRGGQLQISGRIDGTSLKFAISSPRREIALGKLADGDLDLALTSGRAAADQRQRLAGGGGALEEVAGLQALVLAVHPDNPVGAIDESSLSKLLRTGSGNWRDFGGEDAPIALTASDQLAEPLLHSLAPAVSDRRDAASLELILRQNPRALALLPLQLAGSYSKLAVTAGNADLQPLPALIASEDYPLSRRLYLYARPGQPGSHLDEFVEFVLSDAGQALVDANNLVSLKPRPLDIAPRGDMPAPYRKLASEGQRISIAFRFDNGGSELDVRAQQDISRLAAFLDRAENRGRKIALVGFSDRQRRDAMALTISRFRTVIVNRHLRGADIAAEHTLPLGASAPLTRDENTSEQRNARVEVWLL